MTQESLAATLLAHGVRPTAQRLRIASVLFARHQHVSAEQLFDKVNQSGRVAKATVYNNLNLFAEKGLVQQLMVDSGKVFYDSNPSTHSHFYNEDTGQLEDIFGKALVVSNMPRLPENTVCTGVDVLIRCKNR